MSRTGPARTRTRTKPTRTRIGQGLDLQGQGQLDKDLNLVLKESLRTRTRINITGRVWKSVKVTKHGTIRYVRYGFILVCYRKYVRKTHRFEILDFKNAVSLKTGLRVRGGN